MVLWWGLADISHIRTDDFPDWQCRVKMQLWLQWRGSIDAGTVLALWGLLFKKFLFFFLWEHFLSSIYVICALKSLDFPVKVFGKMKSVIATLRRQQQLLLLSKQTKRCIKNLSHPKSVVMSHSTLECCVCVCRCRSRPLHWHHVSIPLHTLNQRAYFCLMTTQIWVLHDEVT